MSEIRDFVLTPEGRRAVADPLALPPLARLVSVLDIIHTDLASDGLSIFLDNSEDAARYLGAGVRPASGSALSKPQPYLKSALEGTSYEYHAYGLDNGFVLEEVICSLAGRIQNRLTCG